MGRERLSAAARALKPMRQGDLDNLCGLYAIVNAIRLLAYPRKLSRKQVEQLFDHGIGVLHRRRRLRVTMADGMDDMLWRQLCDGVIEEAELVLGLPIHRRSLARSKTRLDTHRAVQRIRSSIRRGWPVILALEDRYDHWTVISGFSRTRLALFDSYGFHWVGIRSISTSACEAATPHRVEPASFIALSYEANTGQSKTRITKQVDQADPQGS